MDHNNQLNICQLGVGLWLGIVLGLGIEADTGSDSSAVLTAIQLVLSYELSTDGTSPVSEAQYEQLYGRQEDPEEDIDEQPLRPLTGTIIGPLRGHARHSKPPSYLDDYI